MTTNDTELIQRILSGDQEAFTVLVRKYHKQVHALVWRKIGDFHIAEEITQDTFLRAYEKLTTLKHPNLFAAWLYVIANRQCSSWIKKQKKEPTMQSLEAMPTAEIEEILYSQYMAERREEFTAEKRLVLVKRLLQKLPESERLVLTLHYLAGSSCKEISEFLGVSLNTVKSRLHRARKRLQKEDNIVREILGGFQASTNLTENITRVVKEAGHRINPTVPAESKPVTPWAVATSTLILVALMLGLGAQYLARFQPPYNLDAPAEMTVELVDALAIMNLPEKLDVRNQIGNADAPSQRDGRAQASDAKLSSTASGHVIDVAANPLPGIKIALTPLENRNGNWFPIQIDENGDPIDLSTYQVETDSGGRFTITNITAERVRLSLLPFRNPEQHLLSVEIGGLLVYAREFGTEGIMFSTTLGEDIENVRVTVLHSPKIRGKVQRMDGTPLANQGIELYIRELSLNGEALITTSVATDASGHFEQYIHKKALERSGTVEGPTFHIISVVHDGLGTKPQAILIKPNAQTHELVFTLTKAHGIAPFSRWDARGVWVINPENGHAYKKIGCRNPNDAIAQARKEGAHLVTINNQAEQDWLSSVFGGTNTFIGLNDRTTEGQWQWYSGEPVSYTNWAAGEPEDKNSKYEDSVILSSGKWKDIGPRSLQWDSIKTALIEKEKLSKKR